MSISEPFIRRPVATTLLSAAVFLIGLVAYFALPVASLPAVDFPAIGISAARPGADPETMAATVAAPLERRLANISGLVELTSISSLGSTQIIAMFDLARNVDAAARDVQAAINAAATDLPTDLSNLPTFRKSNTSGAPILVLALTSDSMPTSAVFDAADTTIAQRISQVSGVGGVIVAGAEQPAIRVQVDPSRVAAMGIGLDQVASAVISGNVQSATGALGGDAQNVTIATDDQLNTPAEYRSVVVATNGDRVVRLGDIATVQRGVRNRNAAGWYNGRPAVILLVFKQPGANVIETVDAIQTLLPQLQQWIPQGIKVSTLADRTQTIRASVSDIQRTLFISICLVMAVVFVFLRRASPVAAAGVTVPLSLIGSCAAMWATGFSIDNLSLMALTIAVGFVVDDAIVMIENVETNMEHGMSAMQASLAGAQQIGFTVLSISLSLVAVFIPLLFLPGVAGKLLQEFGYTLTFAILISMVVSLTATPMLCAWLPHSKNRKRTKFDEIVESALDWVISHYARSLRSAIDHPWIMLGAILSTVVLTVFLYIYIPKGQLPQDDIGLLNGTTEAAADVSFDEMVRLQKQAMAVLNADPDVAEVGSFLGSGNLTASMNQGRLFVALKPSGQRRSSSFEVIDRLRPKFAEIPGLTVTMIPSQDLRSSGRLSKALYQYTLSDSSLPELTEWYEKILERLQKLPELADVSSDRQQGGLKANIVIDRPAAARLGVAISTLDAGLNSAFGQRQDSIIYTQRNNYRVVIEIPRARQRDIRDLSGIYVSKTGGGQVPLESIAHVERGSSPLVVNHQGVVPAITITFNVAPHSSLQAATRAIEKAVGEMPLPRGLRVGFAGDAADFQKTSGGMGIALLGALLSVYIILGVLYESYIHPITIISTLPSATVGAVLALELFGMEFTTIAFIGLLLLIGIVKKNGIMLVDFALHAERERGMSVHDAAIEAAIERFRPIIMTTLAALFGALPLAFATGVGAEMRRPLGITIVGGLILSQLLTLYTTPVIYLLMSKLRREKGAATKAPVALAPKTA
ncbi:MAG TPA: efflux RND transporter permease subunit [Methylocystis sp.]|nr:efflux RND transporter permease subunit [Methylocystis sp.]